MVCSRHVSVRQRLAAAGRADSAAAERARTACADNDGDDEPVDAQHSCHDDGHDGLHHQLGPHDTHGGDAHARLGCAIGGAKACTVGSVRAGAAACARRALRPAEAPSSGVWLEHMLDQACCRRQGSGRSCVARGRTRKDEGGCRAHEAEEGASGVAHPLLALRQRGGGQHP